MTLTDLHEIASQLDEIALATLTKSANCAHADRQVYARFANVLEALAEEARTTLPAAVGLLDN